MACCPSGCGSWITACHRAAYRLVRCMRWRAAVKVFEANRRTILGAGMISAAGQVQREGEVVHLVVHRITDLSADLASIGQRGDAFPLTHGRGDEFRATSGSLTGNPGTPTPRDIYIPDLHIGSVRVKSKDFR